jgi:hypothetical protein
VNKKALERVKVFLLSHRVIVFLLAAIFVLNLFDAGVSWFVVGSGLAIELNPLMAALMSVSFYLFFAVKLIMGILMVKITLPRVKEYPIKITVWIMFLIYGLLGLYNLYGLIMGILILL